MAGRDGGRTKLAVRAAMTIGAAIAVASPVEADAATRARLSGTPFESGPNRAALDVLARGGTVTRSSESRTLTTDDMRQLRALGLAQYHAAVVVLRKLPKVDGAALAVRLGELSRSVDKLAPSGACDDMRSSGVGTGLCSGTAPGPLGDVRLRMSFATRLTQDRSGALHLVFSNIQPMEAKPLFGWTTVVERDRLKMMIDLYPADDGWLVYTRLGVEMKKYESSAPTITEAMLKLDTWLARDLGRR